MEANPTRLLYKRPVAAADMERLRPNSLPSKLAETTKQSRSRFANPKLMLLGLLALGTVAYQAYSHFNQPKTIEEVASQPLKQINLDSMLKIERVWELSNVSNWNVAETDFSPDGRKWQILGFAQSVDPELPDSAINTATSNRTYTIPPIINSQDESLTLAKMRLSTSSNSQSQLTPSLIIGNRVYGSTSRLIMLGVIRPDRNLKKAELIFIYADPPRQEGRRFFYEEKVFDFGSEFFNESDYLTFQAGLYLGKEGKEASVVLPTGVLTNKFTLNPPPIEQMLSIQAVFYRPSGRSNLTKGTTDIGKLMVYTAL